METTCFIRALGQADRASFSSSAITAGVNTHRIGIRPLPYFNLRQELGYNLLHFFSINSKLLFQILDLFHKIVP
jgi:hypothetical protein